MSVDTIIKPDVSVAFAEEYIHRVYNIKAVKSREVNSYDDRNFIINAEDGEKYVMKVCNSVETDDPYRLDHQVKVLERLSEAGLPVQRPIKSINGRYLERELIETRLNKSGEIGKRIHCFRVVSYLPGILLDDKQVNVDEELLYGVGKTMANVNQLLTKLFKDDIVPEIELWSLKSIPRLREYVHYCREEYQRDLVMEGIRRYETEVLPVFQTLTPGVIHGDPNEQNLLVKQQSSSFVLSGVIDWQDSHRCPIICDLALLSMYIMSAYKSNWKVDEFALPHHLIKGFNEVWNLSESELQILPALVIGRYAQSLCLGAYNFYELDPTNDYLLVTAANGWRQLKTLCTKSSKEIYNMWMS